MVVTRDLSVLAVNRRAGSLIECNGRLIVRDGVLTGRDRRASADLAAAAAEAGPTSSYCVIGATDGPAVLLGVFALGETPDAPVALTLRDLTSNVDIECADLEPVFGVTPGEHQVIVRLLRGYSSRDIADQFGKSILTIRTHVKRAYGKIGVKTRGQLFARLLPYLSIR